MAEVLLQLSVTQTQIRSLHHLSRAQRSLVHGGLHVEIFVIIIIVLRVLGLAFAAILALSHLVMAGAVEGGINLDLIGDH